MSDRYILDDQGNPQKCEDLLQWGEWFESHRRDRVVEQTDVGDVQVSTVFLGLDHNFGDGPPLLYETMVFGGTLDQEMYRYSTSDDAIVGHRNMVKRVEQED